MDRITHNVRAESWRNIIECCQSRPKEQTAKAWLQENNISEKSYYYWLRKFRNEAYNEMSADSLPAVTMSSPPSVEVAEIPTDGILLQDASSAAVTVRTKGLSIEITSAVSESTMVELVKAVSHAL